MLVEEARVHREDPLADHVEAEVTGFDHARVDRPHGDLVHAVAGDRCHPRGRVLRVRYEGAHRLVAGELEPVQIVGLALIPARGFDELDDALDDSARRLGPHDPHPVR